MFNLTLAIATFLTGILWCLERFKLIMIRRHLRRTETDKLIQKTSAMDFSNKPTLIEICTSMFPILLLVFMIRSFIFEPFQIPSGSMMPTLLVGDFIVVEKFSYGIKDPITQTTLVETGHPKRGDIVVFKYPLNPSLDYIKRVVGLPGDRICYDMFNKHVTIQPCCIDEQNCTMTIPITYSDVTLSNFVQTFNVTGTGKFNSSFLQIPLDRKVNDGIRLMQCKELLGEVVHDIMMMPGQQDSFEVYYQQQGKSLAEWTVPPGEYFVMGDNRDNSADSRYWGFVPEKNLVGKAKAIWMSVEKQANQWPTGVRFNRIGSIH